MDTPIGMDLKYPAQTAQVTMTKPKIAAIVYLFVLQRHLRNCEGGRNFRIFG